MKFSHNGCYTFGSDQKNQVKWPKNHESGQNLRFNGKTSKRHVKNIKIDNKSCIYTEYLDIVIFTEDVESEKSRLYAGSNNISEWIYRNNPFWNALVRRFSLKSSLQNRG